MIKKKLNLEWTNRVEVVKEGANIERLAIWEGVNQDGKRVRVYVKKIDNMETDQ